MDFTNMKFDILIQAGQSNAEGNGLGPADESVAPNFSGNAWQIDPARSVVVGPEAMEITYMDVPFEILPAFECKPVGTYIMGNFVWTFVEEYEKQGLLEEGRQILIIKAAIGGTGFIKKNWGVGRQLYEKLVEMTDYALSLNPENCVVGLLWHQGECDAFEGNTSDAFGKELKEMLEDILARYGANLPMVAGDFVNDWKSKNIEICEPIVAKIQQVLDEMGNADFVETADLLSNDQKNQNGDDIHFCRESLCVLGRRYFEKFKGLKNI